ncbi:MAG: Uncharacterised protein [Prochlorococcus marinus str. MIT 9313]|nr:MAG: Uncharacterised protein [Prochlorococcus marinus str. MIT 9313]
MADADIALHFIDIITFAVDAIPAIKSCSVEVVGHFSFFGLFELLALFHGH